MRKSKQNEERMKSEAEKCRKTAEKATKEHGTMKEQYSTNLNILKWNQAKLKSESEALGQYIFIRTNFVIRTHKSSKKKVAKINHFKANKKFQHSIRTNAQFLCVLITRDIFHFLF